MEVKNLVPAGTEPHEWEPGARDVASLEDADVFVYNGAEMEHWTDTILNTWITKSLLSQKQVRELSLPGSDGMSGLHRSMQKRKWKISKMHVKADPKHRNVYEENYKKKCRKM